LPLAQRAVRLAPENVAYRNTLGVAYYRLGQWDRAVDTLQRAIRESKQEASAYDLFFLALSYQRLGQPARARECYDQALRWCQAQGSQLLPQQAEEVTAFRAEADGLLKKPAKP
jgi:Flp pilus assembly protein TadD